MVGKAFYAAIVAGASAADLRGTAPLPTVAEGQRFHRWLNSYLSKGKTKAVAGQQPMDDLEIYQRSMETGHAPPALTIACNNPNTQELPECRIHDPVIQMLVTV